MAPQNTRGSKGLAVKFQPGGDCGFTTVVSDRISSIKFHALCSLCAEVVMVYEYLYKPVEGFRVTDTATVAVSLSPRTGGTRTSAFAVCPSETKTIKAR